jgi:hypothetical protein
VRQSAVCCLFSRSSRLSVPLSLCLSFSFGLQAIPAQENDLAPRHRGAVTALAFAGDELYSASQAGILASGAGGERLLADPGFRVVSLAAAAPSLLLLGGGRPGLEGRLALIRSDGSRLAEVALAEDMVYDVAVSPCGRRAAAACADGRVLICELPELGGVREAQRHTAPSRAVAFSPDGRLLASGGLDRVLLLSRAGAEAPGGPEGEPPAARLIQDHSGGIECLAFSADSRLLASGARDGKVRLHGADGRLLRTFLGLGGEVRALAWSEERGAFIAGLGSGRIQLLPVAPEKTEELIAELPRPVSAIALAPGGEIIAGSGSEVVRVRSRAAPEAGEEARDGRE